MKTIESNPQLSRAISWLLLVCLPFLSIGLYSCWRVSGLWSEYAQMKSWVEVPATIKTTELEDHSTHKGKRFEVFATYDYEFNKQPFSGSRVTLISGHLINSGYFNRDAYDELKLHRVERTPFRCYVNPEAPQDSILFRDLPGNALVTATILATIPGTLGGGLLTLTLVLLVFGRAERTPAAAPSDLRTASSDTTYDESSSGSMRLVVFWAVVGSYWTIACLPLDRKIIESITQSGSVSAWFATPIPLVGIAFLLFATRELVRVAGFGNSDSRPASTLGVARPSMT